eukprot:CAMPEP_0177642478 /NCGR_PEP_ID=MMETSP0447-20121125/7608_1 /TAXON_ID=0 /ORGANISM="Stygamoeba regulata, Strain BSH-02190019" /LENGTH=296 /DNA_ID=CAMNT_0019144639 /DNA_START=195 /DNA_END=1082 /DNA_ORIENTATION=+
MEQIRKDINRTFPTHTYFMEEKGQRALFNVLNAYAVYDESLGYCQGMSFVVGLLLMYMREEDAFWVLVQIVSQYDMRGQPKLPMLPPCLYILERLMQAHVPRTFKHLEEIGVEPAMYATPWLLTLFLVHMPFEVTLRIWDLFFERGFLSLYGVILALFKMFEDKFDKMEFEEVAMFLKFDQLQGNAIPANEFIKLASRLKPSAKQVAGLQRDWQDLSEEERIGISGAFLLYSSTRACAGETCIKEPPHKHTPLPPLLHLFYGEPRAVHFDEAEGTLSWRVRSRRTRECVYAARSVA